VRAGELHCSVSHAVHSHRGVGEGERAAEFGADFGLFNNALTGSFDYFSKTTSNIQATPLDVPTIFGATPPQANVAKVKDQGWEFELTYTLKTNAPPTPMCSTA